MEHAVTFRTRKGTLVRSSRALVAHNGAVTDREAHNSRERMPKQTFLMTSNGKKSKNQLNEGLFGEQQEGAADQSADHDSRGTSRPAIPEYEF